MGNIALKPDTNGTPGFPDGRPNGKAITPPNTNQSFDDAWAPYLDKATTRNIWKTYKVISGPEIKKVPMQEGIGEIWGKYKKIYSKMLLGGGGAFNPPLYFLIDDVRVLCACRDIRSKFYSTTQNGSSSSDIGLKAKIISG